VAGGRASWAVDAVFDHFGMASARISFGLLVRGSTLVSYGTAQSLDADHSMVWMFLRLLTRLSA
jgi:NADPH:quinone reductase-like Zn-dependent oxidoreductase